MLSITILYIRWGRTNGTCRSQIGPDRLQITTLLDHVRASGGGGGGGGLVFALEMGMGVPTASSKPDPVAIRLMAKKTPCPNFEINTGFNWLILLRCNFYLYTSCFMVFFSSLIFVYAILRLSALRLEKSDGIRLIMAWEICKIHANRVPRVESPK